MFTKLQKQKINRLFTVCDANGDGYWEVADLDRVARNLAAIRGHAEGSPYHQALRARYGAWGEAAAPFMTDGRMTMRAHLAFHEAAFGDRATFEGVLGAIADMIFEVLDGDGDGRISREEFASFHRAYEVAEEVTAQVFPRLDTDGDGTLSRDEVRVVVGQFYQSDDPDAPGNWLFGPWSDAPVEPT